MRHERNWGRMWLTIAGFAWIIAIVWAVNLIGLRRAIELLGVVVLVMIAMTFTICGLEARKRRRRSTDLRPPLASRFDSVPGDPDAVDHSDMNWSNYGQGHRPKVAATVPTTPIPNPLRRDDAGAAYFSGGAVEPITGALHFSDRPDPVTEKYGPSDERRSAAGLPPDMRQ
jgi:hypothetical protein